MTQQHRISNWLNGLSGAGARSALTTCCAAKAWVDGMLDRRPFADDAELLEAASRLWRQLPAGDWLEAFAAHPLIGGAAVAPPTASETLRLSATEQAAVARASRPVLDELAKLNLEYRERFGFIFLVCAAEKTAAEMLALLKARLNNSRDTELANAAEEQLKITCLRLAKLAGARWEP
jgi:OHCU decarboxylase